MNYETDTKFYYTEIQIISPSFFFIIFFLHISQMLNVSTFGYTADIYTIIHFILHASAYHGRPEPQQRRYCCFLAANHGSSVRGLSLKNTWRVFLSIDLRIIMTHWVVYFLLIF
jgi:hypothetical protein